MWKPATFLHWSSTTAFAEIRMRFGELLDALFALTDVLLDGLNLPHGCLDHEHRRPNHGLIVRGANGLTNLSNAAFHILAVVFRKGASRSSGV